MAEPTSAPWYVVLIAAIPSAGSGLWVAWRWWIERTDKHTEGVLTREERLTAELDKQRAALSAEHAALFDRLKAELVRVCARLEEVEKDRDRGWDLARWWNRRAHELRHAGLNAQTMVAGLVSRDGLPMPNWPDMSVPGLEDPK
jgi:hypothetical protein